MREFLKEYLIIVVGVLTALGAEQAAEALRHRADAAEAQDAIRAEVVVDITRIEQRDFAYDCVEARLDELERVVDTSTATGGIRGPSWIGRPPRYAVEAARWDAASQSGRVSLLPTTWQSRFGFLYTTLRYYYEMNNAEQQTWSRLDGLTGLDRLSPDGKLAAKAEIEQARFYNGSMHQVAGLILSRAAAEGLRPTLRRDPPFSVCWAITTPTREGLARMPGALAAKH
ncbi:MAG TPA: hypothetical protein VNW53_06050 [Phenylobacterium sp.]|uniref:hypothetical protein n=1 Tax=Phenylobacterium sp. TaxID=1871053 RepID=UPI002C92C938|nr:hypothetical protein [Phenylobacterium sp.]HXA38544.1 hypothetical protein [Phenylobacterium sp.]